MARGSVYGTRGIGLVVVRHPIPAHILPSTVDCEQTTMRWISLVLLAFAGFASAQYYLTREYPLQPTWMRILTASPSRSLGPRPVRVPGLLSHPHPRLSSGTTHKLLPSRPRLAACAYECAITSCKGEKADCVCGHESTNIDSCISAICPAGLPQAEARESVKKFCRR